eukprot:NODE_46_length_32145_cov_0.918711.p27 type:complete len:139 gc:universal NODE_46_length_32145_cov_0.918711:29647-29231(-)
MESQNPKNLKTRNKIRKYIWISHSKLLSQNHHHLIPEKKREDAVEVVELVLEVLGEEEIEEHPEDVEIEEVIQEVAEDHLVVLKEVASFKFKMKRNFQLWLKNKFNYFDWLTTRVVCLHSSSMYFLTTVSTDYCMILD